ncbi:MDR family MFS transporter [Arthrobacter sp. NEB 688]|uniref:MDR family MFS transporter n=1 Tax=Arthrobacter sp. NEB 688 TaxID=904039 RepID=UPI0015656506|nr:MDR family MFS transporter [Arthrobacter sp. NEB 688]QKE85767.1 MFS transporter [Arthrobacter sp. NEB 688]
MTTATATAPQPYKLSPASRRVFLGLMLGMLVASVSQTIVGPAMPRIVSELGGMDHYSWVATAALLVSAITVPIVGKFSDLYGRRGFYIAGLVVFMVGSLVAGFAQSFWVLVAARAIQGLGMGTVMPLSQTIIGDIIPPRQRGKYQGLMGAVFGVTSVAGPLAGGFITDHWGWRWLFFAGIPIGVVATGFILRFLHLPHERREAKVDSWGIATLAVGLTAVLLATSWGGTSYPWGSATIIGLYVVGVVGLVAFVFAENRAEEPVIPLRLFRSRVFTAANIASFGLAMVMFGSIIYIPVFAQGVLGVDATNSGLILAPLMVGLIVMGILTGLAITRTGVYKPFMVVGVVVMGAGIWLLTRLTFESTQTQLTLAMVVLGIGIGMAMQQYTLVVQNASEKRDLGVATASSQFFRNVGSTVGIAVFGTVLTSGLGGAIASHLPAGAAASMPEGAASAGSVLDPAALAQLPPAVATAVRQGLADQLHEVFLIGLPVVALVLLATFAIKALPLRDSNHDDTPAVAAEHAGHEMLDTMSQSSPEPVTTPARATDVDVDTDRDAAVGRQPEPAVR